MADVSQWRCGIQSTVMSFSQGSFLRTACSKSHCDSPRRRMAERRDQHVRCQCHCAHRLRIGSLVDDWTRGAIAGPQRPRYRPGCARAHSSHWRAELHRVGGLALYSAIHGRRPADATRGARSLLLAGDCTRLWEPLVVPVFCKGGRLVRSGRAIWSPRNRSGYLAIFPGCRWRLCHWPYSIGLR
jgi:hypothetical protein